MKTEREVAYLLARLYTSIGGDATELKQIVSNYGSWYTAFQYEIVRADGSRAVVRRKDIENNNDDAITEALRSFAEPRVATRRQG